MICRIIGENEEIAFYREKRNRVRFGTHNPLVAGSNPAGPTIKTTGKPAFSRVSAFLVHCK